MSGQTRETAPQHMPLAKEVVFVLVVFLLKGEGRHGGAGGTGLQEKL